MRLMQGFQQQRPHTQIDRRAKIWNGKVVYKNKEKRWHNAFVFLFFFFLHRCCRCVYYIGSSSCVSWNFQYRVQPCFFLFNTTILFLFFFFTSSASPFLALCTAAASSSQSSHFLFFSSFFCTLMKTLLSAYRDTTEKHGRAAAFYHIFFFFYIFFIIHKPYMYSNNSHPLIVFFLLLRDMYFLCIQVRLKVSAFLHQFRPSQYSTDRISKNQIEREWEFFPIQIWCAYWTYVDILWTLFRFSDVKCLTGS